MIPMHPSLRKFADSQSNKNVPMHPSFRGCPQCDGDEIIQYNEQVIPDEQIYDISKSCDSNYFCVFNKIPESVFYLQTFSFPYVTNRSIEIPRPNHASRYQVAGHSNDYDDLSLDILMDENFKCYFQFLDWMRKNEVGPTFDDMVSMLTLVLLNNAKMPIVKVNFRDVFPYTLSGPMMQILTANSSTFNVMCKSYNFSVQYMDGSMFIPIHYTIN